MKKILILLTLFLILLASGKSFARNISKTVSLNLHYPGIGLKYGGGGKWPKELRASYDSEVLLLGNRLYRTIKQYNRANIYLGLEVDLSYFNVYKENLSTKVSGYGGAAVLLGMMEFFVGNKFWVFWAGFFIFCEFAKFSKSLAFLAAISDLF